ncbi:hypothetical protein [Bacillus sp. ISL-39]|uniref:hypothetical protein n=1 Tax=Bacillus sp. ISL-39 TaxID=2819124 RepID=UPI001BEC7035|nr:hypothetical protein [Bacillus sp. ISL-39]MBT2639296.1 hypothetical protein [Bacillus sp. ISL-39]
MFINTIRKALTTDSGMHCVWDFSSFASVKDFDSWEEQLLEDRDILEHIRRGSLVPININSDGAFEFEMRIGTIESHQQLTERERKYLTVSSEKYRLVSNGSVCISGIEYVCNNLDENIGELRIPRGTYSATVHLIAWDDEPNMKKADGTPKNEALPDFVIIVNPEIDGESYRVDINTFPASN